MAGSGPDQHCTMSEDNVTREHLAGYGQGRSHPASSQFDGVKEIQISCC